MPRSRETLPSFLATGSTIALTKGVPVKKLIVLLLVVGVVVLIARQLTHEH
ncbi:MAG TPA: hypothetical protein VGB41_05825 [Acidimicrobiia bacterium]